MSKKLNVTWASHTHYFPLITSLNLQHHLAKDTALFQQAVSLTDVAQGQSCADHGLEFAVKDQIHHPMKILGGSHRASDQADLLVEDVTDVEVKHRTAGVADDQNAPAAPHTANAVEHGRLPDVVHHYVHALSIGQPED